MTVTDATTGFFPSIVKIESIGYSEITDTYGPTWGSGTLIASDIVLTSAHVIYSSTKNEYFTNITVTPATIDGNAPFGVSSVTLVKINPLYASNPVAENDYAVIKLSRPLGSSTGYLNLSSNINKGDYAQTAGYPEDRVGKIVFSSGNIITVSQDKLTYRIDTRGGQSGSPILNADNEVVGVHSGFYGNVANHAARVTPSMLDLINSIQPLSGAISFSYSEPTKTLSVYRLYHSDSKRHHYTSSIHERNTLVSQHGWTDEGVAWKTGDIAPVYRLYHPGTKDHILTTDMSEVQVLQKSGWANEGVVFQTGTGVDVFRLYSQVTLEHFYTADINEKNSLINAGWNYEGIAFKAN
ncbi:TPA: trypsin-like peptidase domain-containing protein [Streptococcus suis]